MSRRVSDSTSTLLSDGAVLIAGGYDHAAHAIPEAWVVAAAK
jgi:hypothetical protein